MTDPRHLVWIASVPWDGIPGTERQMVTAMTRYARSSGWTRRSP